MCALVLIDGSVQSFSVIVYGECAHLNNAMLWVLEICLVSMV